MRESLKIVDASPVKSFFVQMLTRDISLTDAILDLLDNCIDGIMRSSKKDKRDSIYAGHKIEIFLSKSEFVIRDNCGGIPEDVLRDYAFRMGRAKGFPNDKVPTVGSYGIGMKRAIFKMGRECKLKTRFSGNDRYGEILEVCITPKWIDDENDWQIPLRYVKDQKFQEDGTEIRVSDLNASTSHDFDCKVTCFDSQLRNRIAETYCYMIEKGLSIYVNDQVVIPFPLTFRVSDSIKPFIYKTQIDNVDVLLTIGLTAPISSDEEIDEDSRLGKYTAKDAGWVVICNDRVVVWGDKSELTGWGEAGVPQFHPQYNSIRGIVSFTSNDIGKLPTTTTKRGIDGGNIVYLKVKNVMRDGIKRFTSFTNAWKRKEPLIRGKIASALNVAYSDIKERLNERCNIKLTKVRNGLGGEMFKGELPMPKKEANNGLARCSVEVDRRKLTIVAEYLDCAGATPKRVVEESFENVYDRARV